jgi:hypothetical protein
VDLRDFINNSGHKGDPHDIKVDHIVAAMLREGVFMVGLLFDTSPSISETIYQRPISDPKPTRFRMVFSNERSVMLVICSFFD